MDLLAVSIILIAVAAVLLAIANRVSGSPPNSEQTNLAETTDSPTGPREAVAPIDRRGRRR